MKPQHIPVMAHEVLTELNPQEGGLFIDGTCGLGGHTRLLAERVGKTGRVFAFDKDARNLALAQEALGNDLPVTCIHDTYVAMEAYIPSEVDGVLLDLGYSSVHVDDPERGFSFQHDGPLDMRYDASEGVTAEDIVNGWSRDDLAEIFRLYGEEPRAHLVAKAIFDARRKERLVRTVQLADVIATVVPRTAIHPATRVFQALRIAVNDELGAVRDGIAAAMRKVRPGGVVGVISFHSLEDRIVKQAFLSSELGRARTKKPLVADFQELRTNPRSRSAKFRVWQKHL